MGKQRNESQMFPVVKRYLASNQSKVDFCGEHNIKVHTFQYWIGKYKEDRLDRKQLDKFVPIQIQEDKAVPNRSLRVTFPNGTKVELPLF